jgi:hypothetical protein
MVICYKIDSFFHSMMYFLAALARLVFLIFSGFCHFSAFSSISQRSSQRDATASLFSLAIGLSFGERYGGARMLKKIFLAPGYYFLRKFSKKRKKFRHVSSSFEAKPAFRLSLLFWLVIGFIVAVSYAAFSGGADEPKVASPDNAIAPYPSALPGAETEPEYAPPPPSMAESARLNPPVQAGQASTGSDSGGGAAPTEPRTSVQSSAAAGAQGAPPPLVVPPELMSAGDGSSALKTEEVWLVIVSSSPKADRDKVEADQARHRRRGVNLEIMDTDAYPLLKSGMWTLALGPYYSRVEAENAAKELQPKVKETMVRRGL